jgi:hypothetical protein
VDFRGLEEVLVLLVPARAAEIAVRDGAGQ